MADELTEALKELRTMFPDRSVSVRANKGAWFDVSCNEGSGFEYAQIGVGVSYYRAPTLGEALAKVRAWKAAQEGLNQ